MDNRNNSDKNNKRKRAIDAEGFSSPVFKEAKRGQTVDRQNTPTPPSLCRWIHERLVEADVRPKVILDPCAGQGNLTRLFRPDAKVIEYEIERGKDFFKAKRHIDCDLVVCNPPWKNAEEWLRHIVKIVGNRTPVVFVCPMLFFSGYKTAPCRKFLDSPKAPVVSHITPLPQDTFVGVYSSAAIVWLNLPGVRDVALVPSEYLIRSNQWNRLDNEKNGQHRKLPGSVLPPKTDRDEPYARTCRPTPRSRDVRWAELEMLLPTQSL